MTEPLRPMSTGQLLDRTFTLYRRNFLLFIGIAMVGPSAGVAADGGKIGRGLAVKQSQFAQLAAAERVQALPLHPRKQRLQLRPVRLALVEPGNGDHSFGAQS